MISRLFASNVAGLLFAVAALGIEESDVLFFAPFEDATDAALARGDGKARVKGAQRFDAGVRGKALALDGDSLLTYVFKGNVVPDEGTIMMWVKPEWRSDDGRFHYLFRASTGHFGGKALNAVMLYEYVKGDRLQFYTSKGQETSAQEGRTLAYREPSGLQPGRWAHVAATWGSTLADTEMHLYLDGERVASAAGAVFVPERAPETFEIGGPKGAGVTWFDDVMVFSRPLLAREVGDLYRAYRGRAEAGPAELPFASSREVLLRPFVLFGRNELVVEADVRGARRELGGRPGSVEVVLARDSKETKRLAPTTEAGLARIVFDYDKVGSGPCELRATLRDGAGKLLRAGQLRHDVPAKPVWLGNHLGKSDAVPPPWTPVRATESGVEMWGRKYFCDGSPLLTQAASQGRELLRSPVTLSLRSGGEEAALRARPVGAFTGHDAAASCEWEGTLGPLACKATSRIEFDGFMRLDVVLSPGRPADVDALTLVVPLRHDAATLYHHANGTWTDLSDAGAIGPASWRKAMPFVPYVWLGTERGGLAWFCEHNANWRNADENRAVEFARAKDGVDLTIRFVDRKTTLTGPLRLTFGFMATPVKPLPRGWRDWRHMSISAVRLDGFARLGWAAPGYRNIGHLWNNHVGNFSWLPADPAAMREKVSLLRAQSWQTVLSYYALNYTQIGTPDFTVAQREWRRNPYAEHAEGKMPYATVCNASTWADFLVWAVHQTMDQTGTDGVYLDCSNPNFCRSAEHGCAPGRYPLFATRELQKRIYTLVKQKRGAAGHVYNHNSENHIITTFSFCDSVLNGEQFNRKDLRTLTLEKFRAEFLTQPCGVPSFLLPTLVKFQPDKKEKMPGAEFLAFPLLHDVVCVHAWMGRDSQELNKRIQAILHDFGVAEAEFLPYWENAAELAVSPAGATVSAYLRRNGLAALLIGQGGPSPAAFEVTLHGRLAKLRGAPAQNALTRQALSWTGGTLLWPQLDRKVQLLIVRQP